MALFQPATAMAYDFEVEGIYYKINGTQAAVTYQLYNASFQSYQSDYSGHVTIPATVTYDGTTYSVIAIDDNAFYNCKGLTNIDIPNSVTSIGTGAFWHCNGLTNIDIPNSVTTIGEEAFIFCYELTSVTIPNSVTTIGRQAFLDCISLTSVSIGSSVTSIDARAFQGCTGLTSIIIPNSVTSIGGSAFNGCSGLTSLSIGNSVTTIGEYAFVSCKELSSVTIPNSVTSIGNYAFLGCTGLNDVFSLISNPMTVSMGSSIFSRNPNNYTVRTLHVPYGSASAYQADTKWSSFFGSIVEMELEFVLATSIELNRSNVEVNVGETIPLLATVLPEDATDKTVTWASSDENVAMVDENGLVTAVAPGTATITATTNDGSDLNASCNVTVLQGIVLAESIKLNVTTAGLNEGSTLQLTATVLPEDCDNKTVLWSSDNPSVATVDSNGLVTAHSVGTATITATTTDGSNLSTTCTVTLLPVGVKGDVNGDSSINISDVTALINFLLSGTWN